MRALLAIASRELRDRWTLALAFFGGGFVLLFLVRYVDVTARALATFAAVASAWGVALLMGGSVIARDLAEGRLGFFFARPVPWWSIAGGKLLAAVVLSIAVPIAGALPTVLFDWSPALDAEGLAQLASGGQLALLLALLLALIGFGHVASVVYRARSPWAAADFLLLWACVLGGVWLSYAFARLGVFRGGQPMNPWLVGALVLVVAVVCLTAALVQVAVGRSDLQRGHKALSLAFWSPVLVGAVALGALYARELAVTPAALRARGLFGAAPDGRLVGISGSPGRARHAGFVYDTESGRSLRLGLGSRPVFSADGRHVAWLEDAPFWRGRHLEVKLARLDDAGFGVETVEVAAGFPLGGIPDVALSPRADKLAIAQIQTLLVVELPSGRTLSTTAAADGTWTNATYLPNGDLRAFRRVRPMVGAPGAGIAPGRIEVVSMSDGVPTSVVRLDTVPHAVLISPPEADRVLLLEAVAPRRVSLHDVRTGALVARFAGKDGLEVRDGLLLSNGSVAIVEALGPKARLRIAAEGRDDVVAELPEGSAMLHELRGGLLAVGRVVMPTDRAVGRVRGEALFFANDTAELRGTESGLLPALRRASTSSRLTADAASRLFFSDSDELVSLDPATRERRVLLAAPPAER